MLGNAFTIAVREIKRNLTRAFLTVLGIIIGVASVITMVSLGQATTRAVESQISNLGTNLLTLRPGTGFGPRSSSAGVPRFSLDDVEAISSQISGINAAAPVVTANLATIFRQNARSTQITGTTVPYFDILRWNLADGSFFTESDYRAGRAVCIIGATVKNELFGNEDPIGQRLRIGKSACQVIGVLKPKGQTGMFDQDDTVIVPLTTLERRLSGRSSGRNVNQISISGADGVDSNLLIADITSLMRQRRNLQSNMGDNFFIMDTRQLADTMTASTKLMTTLLAAVAGVSLVVGGIGIMNIMLVSVTERTREIGIRLAIGARAREVLLQFLVEATTLSAIGGLMGISLAFGLCVFLARLIEVEFVFDPKINLIAIAFSMAVGIVFGFAPARRAAALDPIDALRHE